ncbi:MAG TPA: molecular chaperone DnaJ [Acidimicrobiales bacterium]|nr:molecular chaperone DnaJ [Acidimicrobiales bacterium]
MVAQREWLDKDYYQVLGVSKTATDKEITRAYRKLAKQFHPDANPGSEERFKEISAAYDVLGDTAKRQEYDEVRRLGASGFAGMGGGGFGGPGGGTFRVEDLGDLGDLLGGLGGFGGGRRGRNAGPRRGADVEAELHLSFEDAVQGVTTSVHVAGEARCETCNGSGAAPGSSPVTCPTCHGRGALDDNQGLFSLSRVCPQCSGRGTVIEKPCRTCRGSGITRRTREVKVRIPAGVEDGQRIRVKGRGAPGRANGPAGDLYVIVHVEPHRVFGRRGRNLTLTAPVTFPEAALGSTVTVPTLDGPVTLRIPAGTSSGQTFRVKGRGVPGHGRAGAGDLLVTAEVAVPKKLTDEQRAAVEEFARVSHDEPRAHLGVTTDGSTTAQA